MRKASNKLRPILGRLIRDIERKAQTRNTALTTRTTGLLTLAKRLKAQQENSKDKVYAIHAPEVACIAKGKAINPYEFEAKVSIAVTAKDSWVVGAKTFKGNPYDWNTLDEVFDQIKAIKNHTPKQVYVNRGNRAAYLGQQTDVIIKRHSKATKRWMKRRNSVEPIIEHLKARHKMQSNWLKGHLGDILTPKWQKAALI
jgi:IS5 family transposase